MKDLNSLMKQAQVMQAKLQEAQARLAETAMEGTAGGGLVRVGADAPGLELAAAGTNDDELLAVHEALERLAAIDARKAGLVKLRYFAGLTFEETAEALSVSVVTAKRDWAYARAWLRADINAARR